MSIHRYDEIPEDEIALCSLSCKHGPDGVRYAFMTPHVAEAVGHYDTSIPTAPSPGRVYIRDENTRRQFFGQERNPGYDMWFFLVLDDPDSEPSKSRPGGRRYQLHHPFRVVIVKD